MLAEQILSDLLQDEFHELFRLVEDSGHHSWKGAKVKYETIQPLGTSVLFIMHPLVNKLLIYLDKTSSPVIQSLGYQ